MLATAAAAAATTTPTTTTIPQTHAKGLCRSSGDSLSIFPFLRMPPTHTRSVRCATPLDDIPQCPLGKCDRLHRLIAGPCVSLLGCRGPVPQLGSSAFLLARSLASRP